MTRTAATHVQHRNQGEPCRLDRRVAVAPMMERTDRHCRYFLRLITRHALLYTEMITTPAILHGDRGRLLGFDPAERPLALQLGGGDPDELAACAAIAEAWGYDEVNLNVGCPSGRVRSGRFGACLMAEPDRVAACVAAMAAATAIPVTVKCRTGIAGHDGYDNLRRFVETVSAAGCTSFIVHARDAILDGLSPRQNREIPPLRHDLVYRLKADLPDLEIVLNGGLDSAAGVDAALSHVDGAMIGRAAYHDPWLLAAVERRVFGGTPPAARHAVIDGFLDYARQQCLTGVPLQRLARHVLGLFQGRPGARAWRRHISDHGHGPDADPAVIAEAAALVAPDGDRMDSGSMESSHADR